MEWGRGKRETHSRRTGSNSGCLVYGGNGENHCTKMAGNTNNGEYIEYKGQSTNPGEPRCLEDEKFIRLRRGGKTVKDRFQSDRLG